MTGDGFVWHDEVWEAWDRLERLSITQGRMGNALGCLNSRLEALNCVSGAWVFRFVLVRMAQVEGCGSEGEGAGSALNSVGE